MTDKDDWESKHRYGTVGYFRDLFANYPPSTKVEFYTAMGAVSFVSDYIGPDSILCIDLE